MHAALVLVLWLFAVALLQFLAGTSLMVGAALCFVVAGLFARNRLFRLIRRIRFLLLAIAVLFAWFTPGQAAMVDLPLLSPTREGMQLAIEHAARLVGVVCCVAMLLEVLQPSRLVSGMQVLCRPLTLIGVQPERVALRLLLVLHYVETAGDGVRDWKGWLRNGDDGPVESLYLSREVVGWPDRVVIVLMALVVLAWLAPWGAR